MDGSAQAPDTVEIATNPLVARHRGKGRNFLKAKIRVAQIITRMVPGGANQVLRDIFCGHDGGYEMDLITGPEGLPPDLAEQIPAGTRVLVVPHLCRDISPLNDWRALAELKAVLREGDYGVVHTHTSKAGVLGRLAAASTGVHGVIHSPHGSIYLAGSRIPGVPRGGVRLRLLLASERYAGRKSGSTLTTLSAHEKGTCADLRLAPAEGIHVVPNGIDITRFDLSSETRSRARGDLGVAAGDRLVLAVGRLSAEKGHAVLMRAFVELASDIADIRLIIAGDGPVKAALAKEAGGLIGQGRIYLPGTRTDVPELLAAADMFVLPSLYEGFGLAALEAMAAGLPVIATNVGGVPELVRDGTDGILVAPGDVGELKESIAALLVDPERAAALAAAARIRSREFTVDRMVEAYYGIYDAHAE